MVQGKVLLIGMIFAFPSWAQLPQSNIEKVRVRVMEAQGAINISGTNLSATFSNPGVVKVGMNLEILNISHLKLLGADVWVVSGSQGKIRIQRPYLEIGKAEQLLSINNKEVVAPVLLFPTEKAIDVISVVDFEQYLAGVTSSEMPMSWPDEALKAQAVAARTYALYQIGHRKSRTFHLEATQNDQVFEPPQLRKDYEKIMRIIRSTRDILLVHNGEPIKAFFHSDCGGKTEDAHFIWGNTARLSNYGTTNDTACTDRQTNRWSKNLKLTEIRTALQEKWPNLSIVRSIKVLKTSPSGRADIVEIKDANGTYEISGHELRKRVGFTRLRSTLFEIYQVGQDVVVRGRGFGHGSGLCQWGARSLAKDGKSFREILQHYFPRTEISTNVVATR